MRFVITLACILGLALAGLGCRTGMRADTSTPPHTVILTEQAAIERAIAFVNAKNGFGTRSAKATRYKDHWVVFVSLEPPVPDAFEFVTICDCGRILHTELSTDQP